MDWAYVQGRGNILIIVDAGSGWVEAFPCNERTAGEVIKCLRNCFCRFGAPMTVVSDNAKEFQADVLREWLTTQGCTQTFTPIYHPRSNGIAERAVQTVKNALKAWNAAMGTFESFLNRILFNHRNSQSSSRKNSPAKILLGRELRMPIVMPYSVGQSVWFRGSTTNPRPEKATFLFNKGRNTAWIIRNGTSSIASTSQLSEQYSHAATTESDENGRDTTQEGESHKWQNSEARRQPALRDRSTLDKPHRFGYEKTVNQK
jgi:hypothetical protein